VQRDAKRFRQCLVRRLGRVWLDPVGQAQEATSRVRAHASSVIGVGSGSSTVVRTAAVRGQRRTSEACGRRCSSWTLPPCAVMAALTR